MSEWNEVSLDNLGGGAAIERFNDALAEVIENIIDPNTKANKQREIKLVVKLMPDQDREKVQYYIHIDKKLAPAKEVGSTIWVGRKRGKGIAYEQDVNQGDLPFNHGENKPIKLAGGNDD